MPPDPLDNLAETLRSNNLLPPGQLDQVVSAGPPLGPLELLQKFQQRGLLTDYQAEQLRQGRGHTLAVGLYVLLEPLGAGGMGQVFRARHQLMDRVAALKLIRPDRSTPQMIERFLREARAAAALSHPHIVCVYDCAQHGDSFYLAMEFLSGTDLAKYLDERGPLPVAEACDLIGQAAEGLQHAHERGLVHRDIKPKNLLRMPDGQVKVLDLGLALLGSATTLTQHGGMMGSVDYIAPEQVTNPHGVDIRADIYSLGCTLYHLLAGRVPFHDIHPVGRPGYHMAHEPPPVEQFRPDLPRGLLTVLRRMMAKRPEDRYPTPAEVGKALAPFARSDRPPQVGVTVAGWLLEELLNGDSEVPLYRASKDGRSAALHLLPASAPGQAGEVPPAVQALAGLKHPALPEIQECGIADPGGRCHVVLELVTGTSLEEYLARKGALKPETARRLFLSLAEGLAVAHARGIVHGKIHPCNILLRRNAPPVLVDFDLEGAGVLSRCRLMGRLTEYPLLFAAPEQVHKGRADARSDVYSLAAVLYHALAYDDAERREPALFDAELVSEEMREMLGQAMDRRSERRPADAGVFRDNLRAAGVPRQVELPVPGKWHVRPTGDPDTEWAEVCKTPATVTIQRGEAYRLWVGRSATDEQLAGLAHLRGLTALQHLNLAGCRRLTDAGLAHLRGLTALRSLDLRFCGQLTDAGLAHLRGLTALQTLDLAFCGQPTDAGLAHLRGLTALQTLDLGGCEQLTDAGLAHLRGLTAL